LQFYIDIGVIAVTVGAGGYKIAVDAKRLAKADETVAHLAGPFNPQKLNSKLLAEEVASGHAFQKHVIDGKEFQNLGIFTRQQFQEFVESIVSNPSVEVRYATNGKKFYLDNSTNTIVIKNPSGEATAFRPDYGPNGIGWNNYLENQVPSLSQSSKNNPGYKPVNKGRAN
ncbi:hypothetical protein CQ054_22705, partial [Ochrobactrum sp. MYb29]